MPFVVIFGLVFSFLLIHLMIPLLRAQMLDRPNVRSSHSLPTPRGGGVSFVLISNVSSVVSLLSGQLAIVTTLPLLVAPLAFVGLIDDRFNLSSKWRYVVQLVTAFFLLNSSPLAYRSVVPSDFHFLLVVLLLF